MKHTSEKLGTLKRKADKWFSLYARLEEADEDGMCECITCGAMKHFKSIHCGHFVSRGRLSTRYTRKNVASQCAGCNCFGAGRQYEFGKQIDERYGEGTADELMSRPKDGFKISKGEYREMIDDFKGKAKEEAYKKNQIIS